MKKILFMLILTMFSLTISAQKTYNMDAPKTASQLIGKSIKTADKAIYKGITTAVYKSAKGKLFFIYTNKKGNPAKKYVE